MSFCTLFGFKMSLFPFFSTLFIHYMYRFLFFILINDFIIFDYPTFDDLDVSFDVIKCMGKTPKQVVFTNPPKVPGFFETLDAHGHMGIISNESFFLKKQSEKFPRSLILPMEKVYLGKQQLTQEEQALLLKFKGTLPRIVTDFDLLAQKLGKNDYLESSYSNDGFRKNMSKIAFENNLSKEDHLYAVGSLSDAQENVEFMAIRAYLHVKYPGEDIKIKRGYRRIDFIVTRPSGEKTLIDVTSPSRRTTDNFDNSYLIEKLKKLPKTKNAKLILYNFAETSHSLFETKNRDPRIEIVSNINFQNLLTSKGIDVDFKQPLLVETDYFTFSSQPTSFTLSKEQAFKQIQFIKKW